MSEQRTQTKRSPNKALIAAVAAMGVLLIGVIVLLAVLLMKKDAAPALPTADAGTGNVVVDDGFDPNAMVQKAAENMFEVKMSNQWVFPDGASPASDAYVANSAANSLPFYFEVILPDPEGEGNDELLYTSPVIPVGSAVRDITLNRDLEAGNYDATCVYHNLNPDNTIESSINIAVHLTIEA